MTTPKPRPGRHGWLTEPLYPGWWWTYSPAANQIYGDPQWVGENCIENQLFETGTLWHPCLPPEPPVL